jgi:hypothetical protein
VDAAEGLLPHEPVEAFDAQGELAQGERALDAETARTETADVLREGVLEAVDDAQLVGAAALDRRLGEAAPAARDERERLHDHPFATVPR